MYDLDRSAVGWLWLYVHIRTGRKNPRRTYISVKFQHRYISCSQLLMRWSIFSKPSPQLPVREEQDPLHLRRPHLSKKHWVCLRQSPGHVWRGGIFWDFCQSIDNWNLPSGEPDCELNGKRPSKTFARRTFWEQRPETVGEKVGQEDVKRSSSSSPSASQASSSGWTSGSRRRTWKGSGGWAGWPSSTWASRTASRCRRQNTNEIQNL